MSEPRLGKDSDSVSPGSNPRSPANNFIIKINDLLKNTDSGGAVETLAVLRFCITRVEKPCNGTLSLAAAKMATNG
jgi:hypothetical protein